MAYFCDICVINLKKKDTNGRCRGWGIKWTFDISYSSEEEGALPEKKIKGENELFILSEHYFLGANWSSGDVHSSKCSV